jgi:hypothetical protein
MTECPACGDHAAYHVNPRDSAEFPDNAPVRVCVGFSNAPTPGMTAYVHFGQEATDD